MVNISRKNFSKLFTVILLLYLNNSYSWVGVIDYFYPSPAIIGSAASSKPLVMALNPASLTNNKSNSLELGLAGYFPDSHISTYTKNNNPLVPVPIRMAEVNNLANKYNKIILPNISYNHHLQNNNTLGVAFYSVGGFGVKYKTNNNALILKAPPPTPAVTALPGLLGDGDVETLLRIAILDTSFAHLFKLKYSNNNYLSLGASLLIGLETYKAKGIQNLAALSAYPSNISNQDTEFSIGIGAKLGALYKINDLFLSLAWQSKIKQTKFKKYKGLFTNQGELDIPMLLTAGAAYQFLNKFIISSDLQIIFYDQVDFYNNKYSPISEFGADNGAGIGWSNAISTNNTIQWQFFNKYTARLGVNYTFKRLANQDLMLENILAPGTIIQLMLNAGLGVKYQQSQFDLSIVYMPNRNMQGNNNYSNILASPPAPTIYTQTINLQCKGLGFNIDYIYNFN